MNGIRPNPRQGHAQRASPGCRSPVAYGFSCPSTRTPTNGSPSPAKVYAPPSIRPINPWVHSASASAVWIQRFMISPMWPSCSGPPSGTVPEGGPEQLGHIGEIMNLWIHTADAEAEWTQGLIGRIEGGAYTFAGEGEPFVGVLVEGQENPYATGE